jgi:hypothetical protein
MSWCRLIHSVQLLEHRLLLDAYYMNCQGYWSYRVNATFFSCGSVWHLLAGSETYIGFIGHVGVCISVPWRVDLIMELILDGKPSECKSHQQNTVTDIAQGARGIVVGWGTMLQAGRSRVRFLMGSLSFSVELILPATTMALGSTQPLTEMSTRNLPGA